MQWLLFLLCPLMMIVMMSGLMNHKPGHQEHSEDMDRFRRENDELKDELSSIKEKLNEKYHKTDL